MFSHIKELFTRPSGYTISRSVRLRSSASAYFNRTLTTPTDGKKWTYSFWIKRGSLTTNQPVLTAYTDANNQATLYHTTGNKLYWLSTTGGTTYTQFRTDAVYRDPSAWYHFVVVFDSTNATSTDRIKMYVNGTSLTCEAGQYIAPALNTTAFVNTAIGHRIGNDQNLGIYLDGYLTEINFIDGQALTPSSFGETDSITGVWKAKKYSGTYGTNGFYLNFSDNSSNTATTIGKDYSGNGNNWTPNNISVTAGVTYDSMLDSPTVSAVSSNYAVLNPLNKAYSTYTLSDGNLNWTSSTINMGSHGTFQLPTSGKYYWEIVMTANAGGSPAIGIADGLDSLGNKGIEYRTSGNKEQNGGVSGNGSGAYGATWTTNDVIGVAYDADTSSGQITFYKNNSSQGVAYSSIQTNFPNGLFPSFQNNAAGTTTFQANFGQRPFTYTPPTGFVALNTYNLPASTIKNGAAYMAATTYTGNGSTQSISNAVNGTSFQPDLVWVKSRNTASSNSLQDVLRGTNLVLFSDTTDADTSATTRLTSFNSNGFTLGSNTSVNGSGNSHVAWQWKAGGSSSSNTNGSITSTVSAGATQGFSVVTYTGNGSLSATVGHGLGVAPALIIHKGRNNATYSWRVYQKSLTAGNMLLLNSTSAQIAINTDGGISSVTSSTFGFSGGVPAVNANTNTYVAYCFSAVAGYSEFGSYTGNGSTDGPFVFTNFQPRFVMIKRTDTTGDWRLLDTSRNTYNVANANLYANDSISEFSGDALDFVSNGFKLRATSAGINASAGTYVYACFASNPFKQSLAR